MLKSPGVSLADIVSGVPAMDKSASDDLIFTPPLSCKPDESVTSVAVKSVGNSCDDIGGDSRDHEGINQVTGDVTSARVNLQ